MFKQTVNKFENKAALRSDYEGEMTYRELDYYTNYVAHVVRYNADCVNAVIGICIQRSFKMIAAMIGALKAGFAYIPIDPSYPPDRISYCLDKSDVRYILCDNESKERIPESYFKIVISDYLFIDDKRSVENSWAEEAKLAYIQYTSGSTGNPRGVMIENKAIMNTLQWQIDYYKLDERDIVLQIPSYAFASSVEDIYSTILSGGTLILIKAKDLVNLNYLSHLIGKYSVTHFIMVPSLYQEFVTYLKNYNSLRFVTIAGEQFDQSLVRKHYQIMPNVVLYNEYGMTETSVACFVTKVDVSSMSNVIGEVLPNMQAHIMLPDEDSIGELCVSGVGLAAGYHKDKQGTDEKFILMDEKKFFRTGDYVKKNADGTFVHMGRKDKQIKVSGQRVNLSEIDNVLNLLDCVEYAMSTIVKIKDKAKILTFIQANNRDVNYFKEQISMKLPSYYMPNFIEFVSGFEHLPNRKIDIKKMGEMFMEKYNMELLHNNEIVIKLIEILKEYSDDIIVSVDLNQDVRKQGLSSLQFIQFIAQIEESFGFEFGYDDLDQINPVSIKELYEYINRL